MSAAAAAAGAAGAAHGAGRRLGEPGRGKTEVEVNPSALCTGQRDE